MNLYKLTLTTIVSRKTFLIFAVFFLILPILLPMITPWEEKPQLLQPARAQTAWSMLWLLALGWLFYQGASFGDKWSSRGVLEYVKTLGTGRLAQLGQIWLSCMTPFLGFVAGVVTISLVFAMPSEPAEAKMWVATNLQYALLFLLVVSPLVLLSIALGTRINATAAYVITGILAIYGLFGIGYLDFFLSRTDDPFFDFIYLISPHYHLADLTNRLVFKLGALEASAFVNSALYLGGLGLLLSGASFVLYREKK
ncbi:MAG: hypothetical protein KDM63_00890 [Verrucomicrobiae bacterium]|nr:hypothetical protein [Verrucomicrobiae bacterium]